MIGDLDSSRDDDGLGFGPVWVVRRLSALLTAVSKYVLLDSEITRVGEYADFKDCGVIDLEWHLSAFM